MVVHSNTGLFKEF